MQAQDLAGDPVRLVALVLGPVARDRPAGVPDGEELLGLATDVVGDDGVRRIEDRLGGAEVLLQHDGRDVGEGPLELQDVADVRAAPAVDRLVGVPDDADVAVRLAQQLDDLVLRVVRVLELVDEDVAEALLVRGPHVVVGLQQVGRHHEQVVEVERVGPQQAALVQRVDLGDALAERVRPAAGFLAERLEVDQLGLGLADDALHRPRRQPLLVEAELGGDHLDEPARVGVVVDGEGGAVARAGRRWCAECAGRPSGRSRPTSSRPGGPTSSATRVRISPAALLVKVMARMPHGGASPVAMRWAMRRVSTRVLPEPAPAMIRSGPPRCSTAARWGRVRSSTSAAGRPAKAPVEVAVRLRRRRPSSAASTATASSRSNATSSADGSSFSSAAAAAACAPTSSSVMSNSACVLAAPRRHGHSHSMVPGGFDVTSSATRFTPSTSLMMREAIRSTRS